MSSFKSIKCLATTVLTRMCIWTLTSKEPNRSNARASRKDHVGMANRGWTAPINQWRVREQGGHGQVCRRRNRVQRVKSQLKTHLCVSSRAGLKEVVDEPEDGQKKNRKGVSSLEIKTEVTQESSLPWPWRQLRGAQLCLWMMVTQLTGLRTWGSCSGLKAQGLSSHAVGSGRENQHVLSMVPRALTALTKWLRSNPVTWKGKWLLKCRAREKPNTK